MNTGQFVDISAAADFLGPGAVEVNRYQTEILDLVRRRGAFGQRIRIVPATGHPSRFFEQTAINAGAAFVDPRAIAPSAGSPTRTEKVVPLKAIVAQINFSLFDVEVTRQQSQFAYLEAKDLADTIDAILRKNDQALWTGSDTSFTTPTTQEYYGVLKQITDAGSEVAITSTSASLVDNIKTEVTNMVARTDFEVRPTAIYANPATLDLLDRELKAVYNVVLSTRQVEGGITVKELSTQAGTLPLIPDWTIPTTPSAPNTIHDVVLVSESMIEYHWLTDPNPRVFQLGLPSSLATQMEAVKFGAVVAKGAAYAHRRLRFTR
ncbi:MAG: hypothetical protein HY046_09790 [Acidobacteria bacterium]|nr:hypothetical protein [Acidobacteriota bacterium]